VFIGRWLTEGETVATPEAPSVRIFASDVYQWGPGGRFIMHPAYGRIGEQDVGGLEVIGYDPATDQFRTYFFDHTGNVITETLTFREGTWTWQATHHMSSRMMASMGAIDDRYAAKNRLGFTTKRRLGSWRRAAALRP